MALEHLSGYQERDAEVVDYQMARLGDTGLFFRGPVPKSLGKKGYVVCLGAAQTFGCFCDNPYTVLLGKELGLPVLNLGYGGAGPLFFLRHTKLLPWINNACAVVVQVMSGRSEDNSLYESGGLEYMTRRSDGKRLSADEAFRRILDVNYLWRHVPRGRTLARELLRLYGRPRVKALVCETRRNWVNNCQKLLNRIDPPVVLFWFSRRTPEYTDRYDSLQGFFEDFPQLVNQSMMEEILPHSDCYVECVTKRGSPQKLISRQTGAPVAVDPAKDRPDLGGELWTHNKYYPSPEMHEDGAAVLVPALRDLLASR